MVKTTSVSAGSVSALLGGASEIGFFTSAQFAEPQVNHILGSAVQFLRDADGLVIDCHLGCVDDLRALSATSTITSLVVVVGWWQRQLFVSNNRVRRNG